VEYRVSLNVNRELSLQLVHYLESRGAPCQAINFFSGLPAVLRWGEVVPAFYLSEPDCENSEEAFCDLRELKGEFIILSTPRGVGLTREETFKARSKLLPVLHDIGGMIREWIDGLRRRVFLLVSGDLAHTHQYDMNVSPLFKPAPTWVDWSSTDSAETFDKGMEHWVSTLSRKELEELEPVEGRALACGYTSCFILQGILKEGREKWKGEVSVNLHPTYFGMMAALWLPPS